MAGTVREAAGNATFGISAATTLTQINTPARNHATVRHVVNPRAQARRPAPATGHYEELNVFGSHTGKTAHVTEGEPLPGAPRGFTWRRVVREDG